MEKISKSLTEAGYTDKEAEVYTALLSYGPASAYTIAEKTGLKAPTVYLTLSNLMSKGLAYPVPRAKKKQFFAKDPKDVVQEIEARARKVKELLPAMLSLTPKDAPKIKIQYYSGIPGIHEALNYGTKNGIPTKEVVGFYASGENVPREYIDISIKYMEGLKKKGVKVRGITPEHASTEEMSRLDTILGHTLVRIPYEKYSAQASIEAEDSIVRVILNHEQKALVIENSELAKMIKQIFEMVWKK